MSYSITDWNLNPNILWFVKISDIGSEMQIDLYETEADAIAETNVIASSAVAFGTGVVVIFADVAAYGISYFNSALSYHMKVTGIDGDTTKIFKIAPFTDLPDVNNSIYRSESLIQRRAIFEINKHVHVRNNMAIGLAGIVPGLKIGDVCRINSVGKSIDVLTVVEDISIVGTLNSLLTDVDNTYYTDVTYE